MKAFYLLLLTAGLASCAGYQPLYGELGNQMQEISVKEVRMNEVEKDIGERRLAQQLDQNLSRLFTNDFDNDYDMYIVLTKEEEAIATRSDDTDQRKYVAVRAEMVLKQKDTDIVKFKTTLLRSSSYTVQEQPFATQAARTKAFESTVSALTNDIVQRAALWFRGYEGHEAK